jgi:transcriptional regulator with XRE-family HTH domain
MAAPALTLDLTVPRKVQAASAFGERRAEHGITQIQLAEMIGSSQRAISAYETVAEYPPTAVVVELAKVLKVSANELLGLKPVWLDRSKEDPEARRLWKKFQQVMTLPEKDQRTVIRLVNSLVETKGRVAAGGAR